MFKKSRVLIVLWVFFESLNASERPLRTFYHRTVMPSRLPVILEIEEDDIRKLSKEFVYKLEKFKQHMLKTKFRITEHAMIGELYEHIREKNIQLEECIRLCEKLHPGKKIEMFVNRLHMDIPDRVLTCISEQIKGEGYLADVFDVIKREKIAGDIEAERKIAK